MVPFSEASLEAHLADLTAEHEADVDARLQAVANEIVEKTGCQPLTAIRLMLQTSASIGASVEGHRRDVVP